MKKFIKAFLLLAFLTFVFTCALQSAYAAASDVPAKIDLLTAFVEHWQLILVGLAPIIFDLVARYLPTQNPQGLAHLISAVAFALSRLFEAVGKALDSLLGQKLK